jgi:hypothetical protein
LITPLDLLMIPRINGIMWIPNHVKHVKEFMFIFKMFFNKVFGTLSFKSFIVQKAFPYSYFNLNFIPLNAIEVKVVSSYLYASQNNTP